VRLTALILIVLVGPAISSAWGWEQTTSLTESPLARPGRWTVERKLASPKVLKPGIYETAPYTCIVIVPRPHVDDRAIVGPRGRVPSMPIITVRPELRFVPRSQRK
jgi:hypothetical protein